MRAVAATEEVAVAEVSAELARQEVRRDHERTALRASEAMARQAAMAERREVVQAVRAVRRFVYFIEECPPRSAAALALGAAEALAVAGRATSRLEDQRQGPMEHLTTCVWAPDRNYLPAIAAAYVLPALVSVREVLSVGPIPVRSSA